MIIAIALAIIQLTKLSGNYNAGMSIQIGGGIIQLTKLSGNYNTD